VDPNCNTLSQVFGDAVVVIQNGEVYSPSVNLYNPSTGTWTTTSSPPVGGSAPIALLPNGDVWTVGDVQGESLYNPSTNQWTTFARRRAQRLRKIARMPPQREMLLLRFKPIMDWPLPRNRSSDSLDP
jgi:hypothetical protein